MELNEDEIIERYAKQSLHCTRNTLLSYGYYRFMSCIACGYNVIKTKDELSKIQRKKMIFFS